MDRCYAHSYSWCILMTCQSPKTTLKRDYLQMTPSCSEKSTTKLTATYYKRSHCPQDMGGQMTDEIKPIKMHCHHNHSEQDQTRTSDTLPTSWSHT